MTSSKHSSGNALAIIFGFFTMLSLESFLVIPAFSQTTADRVSLWVNQVGYTPNAGKVCVLPAGGEGTFEESSRPRQTVSYSEVY